MVTLKDIEQSLREIVPEEVLKQSTLQFISVAGRGPWLLFATLKDSGVVPVLRHCLQTIFGELLDNPRLEMDNTLTFDKLSNEELLGHLTKNKGAFTQKLNTEVPQMLVQAAESRNRRIDEELKIEWINQFLKKCLNLLQDSIGDFNRIDEFNQLKENVKIRMAHLKKDTEEMPHDEVGAKAFSIFQSLENDIALARKHSHSESKAAYDNYIATAGETKDRAIVRKLALQALQTAPAYEQRDWQNIVDKHQKSHHKIRFMETIEPTIEGDESKSYSLSFSYSM